MEQKQFVPQTAFASAKQQVNRLISKADFDKATILGWKNRKASNNFRNVAYKMSDDDTTAFYWTDLGAIFELAESHPECIEPKEVDGVQGFEIDFEKLPLSAVDGELELATV